MNTDADFADIQLFYDYLGRRLAGGGVDISPEDSVDEFRAYQVELEQFKAQTAQAERESIEGLAVPLDLAELRQRVEKRIAEREHTE